MIKSVHGKGVAVVSDTIAVRVGGFISVVWEDIAVVSSSITIGVHPFACIKGEGVTSVAVTVTIIVWAPGQIMSRRPCNFRTIV